MTRLHIHISVDNIEESTKFYSALFGSDPTKQKPDYAKWMLDNPHINFAISSRNGAESGIDHLGIQAENEVEMEELRDRIKQADLQTFDEGKTICCYAKSDKTWVKDPTGVAWETYHTMAESELFKCREDSGNSCHISKKESVKNNVCEPKSNCC